MNVLPAYPPTYHLVPQIWCWTFHFIQPAETENPQQFRGENVGIDLQESSARKSENNKTLTIIYFSIDSSLSRD